MAPQFFLRAFRVNSFEEEFSTSKAVRVQANERLWGIVIGALSGYGEF
jgi:hypothetical protein